MRTLIKNIASYISITNQYTKVQEEQIEYAIRITFFEILKFVGIITIFSLFGYTIEAIIASVSMAICKPFIGGYHEDTQIKCFTASILIIGSIIYLSAHIEINFMILLIINGASLYCIYEQAPVINPKMPLTRPELIKRNRQTGMTVTFLLAIISIIFIKKIYISSTITWTLLYQALLMFNKKTYFKIH